MAQFFFRYGVMNSGKTIELLKVAYNYEEQKKKVFVMTSGLDKRVGENIVYSRINLKRKAISIFDKNNIYKIVTKLKFIPSCILIDEAQFLNKHHIIELAKIVDVLNISVIAFGLKNDFKNELFEGSKYLLIFADKIEEIKTVCWFCNKKAIMNLKYFKNKPIYFGEQLDDFKLTFNYYPVCRKHYLNPLVL